MDRRRFIRQSAAATALIGISPALQSMGEMDKKLTVLHTNDTHSYIDAFAPDHPRYAGKGGVARRAALVKKVRSEEKNVLLLDAGDIFQGTPYFNYYGGELDFKLMSMMGYDVATMGNHDFDNGLEGFYAQLPHAAFDFVSANYDFKNTILHGVVKPYKVIVKDGIRIGIFGLGVMLQGLVDKRHYAETVYLDPVETATEMVRTLRESEKCDLVICLSHLGYAYPGDASKISDLKLAAATQGIDLIIGGHTHTFLERPTVVENAAGKNVIVNQAGCYGVNVGRIDFHFDTSGKTSVNGFTIAV